MPLDLSLSPLERMDSVVARFDAFLDAVEPGCASGRWLFVSDLAEAARRDRDRLAARRG